jgi:predicted nucleic acid-binding protein
MALLVVDASAIAALLFLEPAAEEVAARLEGFDLASPSLLPYEIANVAAMKVRRSLMTSAAAAVALRHLGRLDIRLHAVGPAQAFEAASLSGLTAYDGAYVWLADALGAAIVTLDARVARAARPGRTR